MKFECIVALINTSFQFCHVMMTCIIMFYNANNTLHTHETYFKNGIEIIVATFNINMKRAIHVVAIYKPPT